MFSKFTHGLTRRIASTLPEISAYPTFKQNPVRLLNYSTSESEKKLEASGSNLSYNGLTREDVIEACRNAEKNPLTLAEFEKKYPEFGELFVNTKRYNENNSKGPAETVLKKLFSEKAVEAQKSTKNDSITHDQAKQVGIGATSKAANPFSPSTTLREYGTRQPRKLLSPGQVAIVKSNNIEDIILKLGELTDDSKLPSNLRTWYDTVGIGLANIADTVTIMSEATKCLIKNNDKEVLNQVERLCQSLQIDDLVWKKMEPGADYLPSFQERFLAEKKAKIAEEERLANSLSPKQVATILHQYDGLDEIITGLKELDDSNLKETKQTDNFQLAFALEIFFDRVKEEKETVTVGSTVQILAKASQYLNYVSYNNKPVQDLDNSLRELTKKLELTDDVRKVCYPPAPAQMR